MKEKLKTILLWSQKYTKTDMLYLSKGGFWLAFGQGFRMLGGMVLLVAFANLLPKAEYGTYQFVMSVATVISTFTLSGMGSAITRAVARGNDGSFRYGFRVTLTWSIGMVIAAGATSLFYFIKEDYVLATSFLIAGALLPFLESFGLYKFYMRGKELFKESEILGFFRQLLPIAAILLALFITDSTVILIAVYFVSQTIAAGLVYLKILRTYKPPLEKDNFMVNLSKHLSFLNILGTLATHIDKILIFHFLGAVPVAIYILAQNPITHIRKSLSIITQMIIPRLSKRNFSELQKILPRKTFMFFFVAMFVVSTYILTVPFLFSVFFPIYPEAILVTQVMILELLFYPRSIYSQALLAHALKREIYISRLNISVLKIVLLLILLPMYGMWGAVFANLASHSIAFLVTWYLFKKAKTNDRV